MKDMKKQPNIVMITVDQMRSDCLGVKGHPIVETPHLDEMAKSGFLFQNAYSAVPSCIAARAALMTGMSQRNTGFVGYESDVQWPLYPHTLAGELTKAGYHTQLIGKMHSNPKRSLCGFHNVVLHDGFLGSSRNKNRLAQENDEATDDYLIWLRQQTRSNVDITDTGLDCNSWVARPWIHDETLHPTNWVVTQSIDFLRRRDPAKPFFLNMSFVRPHSPLDPPQVYYDQYIHEDIPLPPVGSWTEQYEYLQKDVCEIACYVGKLHAKALKRARAAYYGLITHIDHQIGRFLIALGREYVLLKDTIFVFVSDHGDMLGDHNMFRKGLGYEGSAAVPLIVYDPGNHLNKNHTKGVSLDQVVELRDIMPTLLEAANVEIPDSVEGQSLLLLLENQATPWREYIHGEHRLMEYSQQYIISKTEKYIWHSQTGKEQYFDLEKDPLELYDLAEEERGQTRLVYWRERLIHELAGREEGYTDGKKLIVGRQPQNYLYTEMDGKWNAGSG